MIEQLSVAERTEKGSFNHWSAKDVVAHISAWKQQAALTLDAAARGKRQFGIDNVDTFNARIFEEQHTRQWSDVTHDMKRIYEQFVARLENCAEADLIDSRRFVWRDNEPLWKLVMCDGYEHPIQHLSNFYLKRENVARATEVQATAVETMARFFRNTDYYSYALYNLGCLYAKTRRTDEASLIFDEALKLNPGLIVEFQQDPELKLQRAVQQVIGREGETASL